MISQFLKPVNFILLRERGFDPWAGRPYDEVSFPREGNLLICSSCVMWSFLLFALSYFSDLHAR